MEIAKEKKKILMGWTINNLNVLVAGGNQAASTPEQLQKIENARRKVADRLDEIIPTNVVSDPAPSLSAHIQQLIAKPEFAVFVQEGWTVKMADLRHVCTVQPAVESIKSVERVGAVDPANLLELAKVSLPVDAVNQLQGTFDQTKNTWQFSSPNPNLRIVGAGQNGNFFGFGVSIPNSYVQVVKCQGKYYLRDGNHRAYGFISHGIFNVPVLYREYNTVSEMGLPQGLYPVETLLGSKPPMLRDFLDPDLAFENDFPVATKVVIIQGLEVSTI